MPALKMNKKRIIPITIAAQEWRYGLYYRPAGIGAVPNGFSRIDEAKGPEATHARHGVIVYNRPLTDTEIRNYELIPFLNREGFVELVDKVTERLGKYARGYSEMALTDPECFLGSVVDTIGKCAGHRVYVGDFDVFSTSVLNRLKKKIESENALAD